MKIYNKLVRDRIPELIERGEASYVTRVLNDDEYKHALLEKIVEEAREVCDTKGERKELIKEIGDVLEVIDAIVAAFELDRKEIEAIKTARKTSRGGFEKKIFLEQTD